MAGCTSSSSPRVAHVSVQLVPPLLEVARRMSLLPADASFQATYTVPVGPIASDGNSRFRMTLPGPRVRSPVSVTVAIWWPELNVLPPSVDLKIHSLKVGGTPVQLGSSTLIFSAATYSVPLAATAGVAPMYCVN